MMLLEKSLAVIFALLVIATLANGLLVWRRPGKDWRELTLRIRTWWVIIVLFFTGYLKPATAGVDLLRAGELYGVKRVFNAGPIAPDRPYAAVVDVYCDPH